ncbi:hypothetical protein C0993_009178 [Termitomyces sp. T159_Od127]|nr:hypothetical protein C0993_009178 [Termitomyces sp. T159_Od127]
MPDPAHQGLDTGRMYQSVEKSSLPDDSTRIPTSHDFSVIREPTRQNEPATSIKTRHVPGSSQGVYVCKKPASLALSHFPVPHLSHSEEREITKPLVPRRREDVRPPREPPEKIQKRSATEQRSSPPGTASISQRPNRKPRQHRSRYVVSPTGEGGLTPDIPEGTWGMRVQQLEELMRELREGTSPLEIGQDQVETGYSTTLEGMMEEISASRKPAERDESRGEERSSPNARTGRGRVYQRNNGHFPNIDGEIVAAQEDNGLGQFD